MKRSSDSSSTPPDSSPGPAIVRPLPPPAAPVFRATVHGLAFDDRARHLGAVRPNQPLLLIPDPLCDEPGDVWVHTGAGDPLGHLPREIGRWLTPWMQRGGSASAHVLRVGDENVPSWKRLLIEVTCHR